MRVLITGAGSIASHVPKLFSKNSAEVLLFDIQPDVKFVKSIANSQDVDIVAGDIKNRERLFEVCKKFRPTHLVHTAAIMGTIAEHNPRETMEVNIIGTANVIEAALRYEVDLVVFCSSIAVYGDITGSTRSISEQEPTSPVSVYGASKLAAESLLRANMVRYGLKTAILRFAGLYGPSKFAGGARMGIEIDRILKELLTTGQSTVRNSKLGDNEYLYVKDAAIAILLACKHGNLDNPLNIGIGKIVSAQRFVHTLRKYFPSSYIVFQKSSYRTHTRPLDIRQARKLLGFVPRFDIENGLKDYIAYLRLYYAQH